MKKRAANKPINYLRAEHHDAVIEMFEAGMNAAAIAQETGFSESAILRFIMRKHKRVKDDNRLKRRAAVERLIKLNLTNAQIVQELDEDYNYVRNIRAALEGLKDAD